MNEIWKTIKETNGRQATKYEVSSFGRRRVTKLSTNKILRLDFGTGNIYKVFGKLGSAHRVIATAFIPNPENKPQVNHKDGNKSNNHIDNLEWCTYQENAQHAWNTGLIDKEKFSKSQKNKVLSEEFRQKLRNLRQGEKHSEETKKKMSQAHENKIVSDETKAKLSKINRLKAIYHFYNEKLDLYEICTMYDLRIKYLLHAGALSAVCNGKRKSTKGWSLKCS